MLIIILIRSGRQNLRNCFHGDNVNHDEVSPPHWPAAHPLCSELHQRTQLTLALVLNPWENDEQGEKERVRSKDKIVKERWDREWERSIKREGRRLH